MKLKQVVLWMCLMVVVGAGPGYGYDGTDLKAIRTLAEQGNPEAQMKLGVMLSSGVGVPLDKQEGLKWYEKSANQGYAPGLWNLAFVYIRGDVVPQDFKKAFDLLLKAADAGYDSAQYDLGMMYLQGLAVPAPDQEKAEVWFRRAAAQGNRDAKKILKDLAASS
ncbi:sel1 repeat family protein [Geomonas nitrogeniifigens]|uniref:Sel1 repeat family protein n=1 Tax=Geomonas diazotrophica TaxID=2843197 RepID=A0ABX8JP92_9BACT|nr:tetratricopeptide repeat protein [Geomonas nitrogeniifigens]QWV98427.1 sel1 repeat family protein [Geomonas nitrogeniifigens]QXE87609.1 sel1 repeat family protein [Geomonas nitrogeniifigens]